MTILYTNYVEVTLSPAQFASYTGIQAAVGDTTTVVYLTLSAAGTINFSSLLHAVPADVWGSGGADVITTGGGADVIQGFGGADRLYGGLGSDLLIGDSASLTLTGNDTLYGGDGGDGLLGGLGNDVLYGGVGDDDFLYAHSTAGNDMLFGGDGWDRLQVQDFLENGTTTVAFSRLILNAAAAIEELRLYSVTEGRAFAISGTAAANLFDLSGVQIRSFQDQGAADGSFIDLLAGNDTFSGSQDTDSVRGGLGADSLFGDYGNDTLDGGAGGDVLRGGVGVDTLYGGDGNDTLYGGNSADLLKGGTGDDVYYYDNSAERIFEATGGGNDTVITKISVVLVGGVENLVAEPGSAGHFLTGNFIGNTIIGNRGNDQIDGRAGNDTLTGGDGGDTFVFMGAASATNYDTITDFFGPYDSIWLGAATFGLHEGTLAASAFKILGSGSAQDADDRIIYNPSSGKLYFDADGSGSGVGRLIAILANHETLSLQDFMVV